MNLFMGIVVKISPKDEPDKVQKALAELRQTREQKKSSLARFYGALPFAFPEGGLAYQKKQRDEWR
jgi:hypothetical protein